MRVFICRLVASLLIWSRFGFPFPTLSTLPRQPFVWKTAVKPLYMAFAKIADTKKCKIVDFLTRTSQTRESRSAISASCRYIRRRCTNNLDSDGQKTREEGTIWRTIHVQADGSFTSHASNDRQRSGTRFMQRYICMPTKIVIRFKCRSVYCGICRSRFYSHCFSKR